jgi:hypothetical protein
VSFERADVLLPGAPDSVALGDLDGVSGLAGEAAASGPQQDGHAVAVDVDDREIGAAGRR